MAIKKKELVFIKNLRTNPKKFNRISSTVLNLQKKCHESAKIVIQADYFDTYRVNRSNRIGMSEFSVD